MTPNTVKHSGKTHCMENMTRLPHNHGNHNEGDIMEHMPAENEIGGVSEAMKQLGDPSRLRIFWLLCHCEECVVNIAAIVGMTSPAVSHHLRLLKGSGLIVSRRDGKEMYYRTADTELAQALHLIIEKIGKITCPREESSEQLRTIRDIHSLMTENLQKRYTIEELSRTYLINTAALKSLFKSVYGMPVASYMKRYRIEKAAQLLRETDDSISVIASSVGYESQSKFTAAFKDVMKMLPTDYRRQHM